MCSYINLLNIMTAKYAHTLISFNEHCAVLTAVKLNTMKNANNPLSRDYNEQEM